MTEPAARKYNPVERTWDAMKDDVTAPDWRAA
jgi:hypothetical protein